MKRDLSITQWKFLVTSLSDAQLLESTSAAAGTERERTAWLVAHLAEVFRRDLALQRGYPSIYKYAREELGLGESQAWERVSAARLALEIPETIERIASGELTLDSAGALWKAMQEKKPPVPKTKALQPEIAGFKLDPGERTRGEGHEDQERRDDHRATPPRPLAQADKREMFTRVLGKSRRESETVLREWKEERGLEMLKPKTRAIAFELTDEELEQFNRLRDLLSHKLNSRDPKAALLWMIENGLEKVDPVRKEARVRKRRARSEETRTVSDRVEKSGVEESCAAETRAENARVEESRAEEACANVARPEDDSLFLAEQETPRHESGHERIPISEPDKRFIWIRDEGKCQYRDPRTGRVCGETAFLDIDHILEVRNGGTNARDNLRLACRAHNRRRHRWE